MRTIYTIYKQQASSNTYLHAKNAHASSLHGGARGRKTPRRVQALSGTRQRDCVAFGSGPSSMPASNPSAESALFFAVLMRTTMALLSVSCAVSDVTCSRVVVSSCRNFFSSSRREPLSVSSREISACVQKTIACPEMGPSVCLWYLGVWACSSCTHAPS